MAACPECKKDDQIQKVSAIVRAQTEHTLSTSNWRGKTENTAHHYRDGVRGPETMGNRITSYGSGTTEGTMTTRGTNQSELAKLLQLGHIKGQFDNTKKITKSMLGLSVLVAFVGVALYTSGIGSQGLLIGIGIIAGLPILAFILTTIAETTSFITKRARNRNAIFATRADEPIARRIWSRLYYCGRDDVAFDPQRNASIPPNGVAGYCYSRAANHRVHGNPA